MAGGGCDWSECSVVVTGQPPLEVPAMAWDSRRITRRCRVLFFVVALFVASHSVPSAFAATLWSDGK